MKSVYASVYLIGALIATINALEFKDCGSIIGKFTKISVSNCDTSKTACILQRNSNATIAIDFELLDSTEKAEQVNAIVHGIIMGVEMPFPLQNPDGCTNSGITCPVNEKQTYEYLATLPVLKQYPKVKVDVKWELKNENKESIVCVLIPAKIE